MARTLKNDAACLKCHTIEGTGGKVGPDLSAIGAKASRENLLEPILYPSRAINHQFQTWVVETKGGLVITGIIAEETPGAARTARCEHQGVPGRAHGHRQQGQNRTVDHARQPDPVSAGKRPARPGGVPLQPQGPSDVRPHRAWNESRCSSRCIWHGEGEDGSV